MNRQAIASLGFLKTTAIGGLFFLLPLGVFAILVGQVTQLVWAIARPLSEYLPVQSAIGYVVLLAISVGLLIAACFLAGAIAQQGIARRFNEEIEKYLLILFPRYTILKERLTGNIGSEVRKNELCPALVRLPGHSRLGFEIERHVDHTDAAGVVRESVTVYLPGSPDPWSGQVIVVQAHHVDRLSCPFAEAVSAHELLGRGTLALLDRYRGGRQEFPAETTQL